MKKIEADCGFKIYDDDNNLLGYQAGRTDNGYIYKDSVAFYADNENICYICEGDFDGTQIADEGEEYLPVKEAKQCGETRSTIKHQVREAFGEDYLLNDEQVDYYAACVFSMADWACIATYLAENFDIEDEIEYCDIKGDNTFTRLQKDAVAAGMTPKEYAEKGYTPIDGRNMEIDESVIEEMFGVADRVISTAFNKNTKQFAFYNTGALCEAYYIEGSTQLHCTCLYPSRSKEILGWLQKYACGYLEMNNIRGEIEMYDNYLVIRFLPSTEEA